MVSCPKPVKSKKAKKKKVVSEIKAGDKFYQWTVIKEDQVRDKGRNIRFICRCDCGTIRSVAGRYLRNGKTKSCHCINRNPSKTVTRICPVCKKEYRIKDHMKKKFCSIECAYKGRSYKRTNKTRVFVTLKCASCGTMFQREKSSVTSSKKNFCSNVCQHKYMRGSNTVMWRGGVSRAYKFGYHTKAYKDWRDKVFTRDKYVCRCCRQNGGYLQAHHIEGFNHNPLLRFSVKNGITLCRKCHMEVHSKCVETKPLNKLMEKLRLKAREITKKRKKRTDKNLMQSVLNYGANA